MRSICVFPFSYLLGYSFLLVLAVSSNVLTTRLRGYGHGPYPETSNAVKRIRVFVLLVPMSGGKEAITHFAAYVKVNTQ